MARRPNRRRERRRWSRASHLATAAGEWLACMRSSCWTLAILSGDAAANSTRAPPSTSVAVAVEPRSNIMPIAVRAVHLGERGGAGAHGEWIAGGHEHERGATFGVLDRHRRAGHEQRAARIVGGLGWRRAGAARRGLAAARSGEREPERQVQSERLHGRGISQTREVPLSITGERSQVNGTRCNRPIPRRRRAHRPAQSLRARPSPADRAG
jgi:hypothetical protein